VYKGKDKIRTAEGGIFPVDENQKVFEIPGPASAEYPEQCQQYRRAK
jgi:hypothetical protein